MSLTSAPRLLLVDDTDANRFVVRRVLESDGFVVDEAASGAAMASAMSRRQPSLIVLDVRLPDINGFEITRRLKSDPQTTQIPILLLSASFTTDEAKAVGLNAGADGYLTHPVEPLVLIATVRALLRARQSDQRFTGLFQISSALSMTLHIDQVAEVVVREVLRVVGADAGALASVDPDDGGINVGQGEGYHSEIARQFLGMRLPPPTHPEGNPRRPITDAISSGEPVVLHDHDWRERYPAYADLHASTGFETSIAVPCRLDDRVVGALALSFRARRQADTDDLRFLMAIGNQCAQAIERANLYEAAQKAQRAAETANQAKVDFLATMSHELRTPLNAIGGYAELLALGLRGPLTPEQAADIERISRSQRHLLNLINEVLNYARLETGRLEYDISDVPVAAMLDSVEAFIAPQVRDKGIEYECRSDDANAMMRADAERVQQILLNLLSNAIKFTPAGGKIVIDAVANESAVEIRVRDTGRGIAREKHESIFEPFVQVDRRLTGDNQGTGLGLSISRELARAMGGDLTVTSQPDSGSTFVLRLPRAAPVPATTPLG